MRVVVLSGGVGGARMARGFDRLSEVDQTVIVNVGDDETTHGLHISPDLDTVLYTLVGKEGPHGWGRADDTFHANDELGRFGVDNKFKLGDRDLALKIFRNDRLQMGESLSAITEEARAGFGIRSRVLPVTDHRLRTQIKLPDQSWISFQEYFVHRRHTGEVVDLRFAGSDQASPAAGVLESIVEADLLVIAPSNPPLSIWPILAVQEIRDAVEQHPSTVAVSPLIGGKPVKGPADRVLASLGLAAGNEGVLAAYQGLLQLLVIDETDAADAPGLAVEVLVKNTLIADPEAAARLARAIVESYNS